MTLNSDMTPNSCQTYILMVIFILAHGLYFVFLFFSENDSIYVTLDRKDSCLVK